MDGSVDRRRLWNYGLALLLAAVQVTILTAALHPTVSDTYRARYIDGTSNCWEYNVSGQIVLGTRLAAADPSKQQIRTVLRCGWLTPERFGTWAVGEEAKLRFKLPATRPDLFLDLTLAAFAVDRGHEQAVRISAGQQKLAEFILDRTFAVTRRIPVPSSLPVDEKGFVEITFGFPDAISGRQLGINRDTRRFAVRLFSLRLAPP